MLQHDDWMDACAKCPLARAACLQAPGHFQQRAEVSQRSRR